MVSEQRPVFVVGPPRSGTKLLRDTLQHHPSVAAVPHNLNAVWRRGREEFDHDEYPVDALTGEQKETLRRSFLKQFPAAPVVLEKNTCHTLRMDYVRAVFPRARFAAILRDPRDAVPSIRDRWKNPLDVSYLGTAFRTWSLKDVLLPGVISLFKTLRIRIPGQNRLRTWGPRIENLDALARSRSLLECALAQWTRCTRGLLSFRERHPGLVHTLHYEDLVTSPEAQLEPLLDFLDLPGSRDVLEFAADTYTDRSVGRGRRDLTEDERRRVRRTLRPLLRQTGYDPGESR